MRARWRTARAGRRARSPRAWSHAPSWTCSWHAGAASMWCKKRASWRACARCAPISTPRPPPFPSSSWPPARRRRALRTRGCTSAPRQRCGLWSRRSTRARRGERDGRPHLPAAPGAIAACRLLCAACVLKELAFAGFRPSLAHCAACGDALSFAGASIAFDAREGGLLCEACAAALRTPVAGQPAARASARRASTAACALARDLLHRPFADAVAMRADTACVREVLRLAHDLVEEHVGSRLRSLSFLLSTWT